MTKDNISVPIWGLFNLTKEKASKTKKATKKVFPSPSGDYLI